jgi:hypothetical protein
MTTLFRFACLLSESIEDRSGNLYNLGTLIVSQEVQEKSGVKNAQAITIYGASKLTAGFHVIYAIERPSNNGSQLYNWLSEADAKQIVKIQGISLDDLPCPELVERDVNYISARRKMTIATATPSGVGVNVNEVIG